MALNLNKEPVYMTEIIYDGQAEQGVEFDYVLPDYYPDVFKILRCTLTPAIVSYSVSGSQLFCDSVVYIKILYLAENSDKINCIEQRYTYSKNIEMTRAADSPMITIIPKTDYCNCRAVSGRRIDVRGAVSMKICVKSSRSGETVCGAEGMGLQTKNTVVEYSGQRLNASRQFVMREDIETGTGKQGNVSIINCGTVISVSDIKLVADKAVIKGEARICALYCISSDEEEYEVMKAVIPVSQIMDIDGLTDAHRCHAVFKVLGCELNPKATEIGENRVFECDMTVECSVTATAGATVSPLCDLYSTEYETTFTTCMLKTEAIPREIVRQLALKGEIECGDSGLSDVYDAYCELSNIVCRAKSRSELAVVGQANMQVIGKPQNGAPAFYEKSEPFELVIDVEMMPEEYTIEPELQVSDVSYSISGENKVDLRVQLSFCAMLYAVNSCEVIADIAVNEEKKKQKEPEYALKLYYAEENEDIWSIAKHYNTCAEAIIAENDLENDTMNAAAMLLIPIV